MKPFTDNIIFWDSEFTDLNPYKGEILSLGFVKPSGEELYIELEHTGEVSDWVKENVFPFLTEPKLKREQAAEKIMEFMGPNRPYLVSYVNQFDTVYFYKMLNVTDSTKEFPFHWIQVDFASMLFAFGIDPERYNLKKPENLFKDMGIDTTHYKKHNALDDARMLRDCYLTLIQNQ